MSSISDMLLPKLCCLFWLLLVGGVTPGNGDFLAKQILKDGEQQLWISYRGLTAKETSYIVPDTGDGLVLREVTDGHRFVQMILNGEGRVLDCQDSSWTEEADKFLREVEGYKGNGTSARGSLESSLSWLSMHKLRGQCRANHRMVRRKARQLQKEQHSSTIKREKRGIRDWFMLPGTHWCGPDNIVTKSKNSLGHFVDTDKCCRKHDRCKSSIPGMRHKFNKYNTSPITLSHCRCDRRFRACLKMADTGPSNLVGKLFFNVVQTKCFVLKPQKMCTKKSWWGKCLRWEYKKAAHIRRNTPY